MSDAAWWTDPEFLRSGELGLYDFEHFVYYLAAHDDRGAVDITADHEYLHHLLTYGTNYGRLIAEARKKLNASGDERDRRVFRALRREVVVVNEMVATYASVMGTEPAAAADLPSAYRFVFDRCAGLVEHSFESKELGIAYAIALGRCLMMVRPSEEALEAVRAGELDGLPGSSSPDKCLDVAERHLLSLPRAAVRDALRTEVAFYADLGVATLDPAVVRAAETEEALLELITARETLEPLLHRVLAQLLDAVLPGIDDAAAEFRMVRSVRLWPDDERVRDPGIVETARGMTQQRIALWQQTPRTIRFAEQPVGALAAVGASGVESSWTHGIYCYAQRPETATEVALVSLRWRDDPPAATYLFLGDAETAALLQWPGPLVTVADRAIFSSLDEVRRDERLSGLLERGCFVHVSENPVDFLLACLGEGHRVTWVYGAAGYQTDAIEAEHGLHLVLYAVEGIGAIFFHFSNTTMTAGLELLTEQGVADPAKVAMGGDEDVRQLASLTTISALLDHPLVLIHARIGVTLPADVRELAVASARETA